MNLSHCPGYNSKKEKVKIGAINLIGVENLTEGQVFTSMKETKQRGHFDPLDPLGPLIVNTVADLVTLHPMRAINGIEEYFYDNYNRAMSTLPVANTNVRILRIEVWRTNVGAAVTQNRNIQTQNA